MTRTAMVALGSTGAAVLLVAAAVGVAAGSEAVTADDAWKKAFDSLLTLAGALVLTGGVGVVIDAVNRSRVDRRQNREVRVGLAGQLRGVHSDVKRAALLIDAHHTALTYGEQMRALIEARVSVGNIRFTATHSAAIDEATRESITEELNTVTDYLQALTAEYRHEYLRISAIQRANHEWEVAQAKKLAGGESPPDPLQIVTSLVPWQELEKRAAFPRLGVLLDSLKTGDEAATHKAELAGPIDRAVSALLKT